MQGRSNRLGSAQFQTSNHLFEIQRLKITFEILFRPHSNKALVKNYLIFGDAIPVEDEKFETDIVQ